jgi:hypothetical protein
MDIKQSNINSFACICLCSTARREETKTAELYYCLMVLILETASVDISSNRVYLYVTDAQLAQLQRGPAF